MGVSIKSLWSMNENLKLLKNDSKLSKKKKLEYERKCRLRRKYGISVEEYKELFKNQNGQCAICKKESNNSSGHRLSVDHCHITKRVRGLLCSSCNNGLGRFRDDPILLQQAIEYLNV